CSSREAVKDCPQLVVLSAIDVHRNGVALFRCSRGMEPVCGRKLYDAAFQMCISNFVMLFGRQLVLHWRIRDPRYSQFTVQTRLIKLHGFGAVSVKQEEGGEIQHVDPLWLSYLSFGFSLRGTRAVADFLKCQTDTEKTDWITARLSLGCVLR